MVFLSAFRSEDVDELHMGWVSEGCEFSYFSFHFRKDSLEVQPCVGVVACEATSAFLSTRQIGKIKPYSYFFSIVGASFFSYVHVADLL